ncbi:MAG: c-type cytochrome [Verrucomicrobiales bacterium]
MDRIRPPARSRRGIRPRRAPPPRRRPASSVADRLESIRPGYEVVRFQQDQPRFAIPVKSAALSDARRRLRVTTAPRTAAFAYAITLDTPRADPGIPQIDAIDLAFDLGGIEARWRGDDGSAWDGWLPHPDPAAIREFTRGSASHQGALAHLTQPGRLTLRAKLDLAHLLHPAVQPGAKLGYTPVPETATVRWECDAELRLTSPDAEVRAESATAATLHKTVAEGSAPVAFEVEVATPIQRLDVAFHTAEDARLRPLGTKRFLLPFAVPLKGESGIERVIPEIAGGDPARGKALYFGKAACFTCHTIRGEGSAVGPDLSNTPHRDYASVLRDIIDPNAAINPDAVAYEFTLRSGATAIGTRVGESATEIKVAAPGGAVASLKKSEIAASQALPNSLMPPGLLQSLSEAEVKDLMAFLLTEPAGE